MGGRCGRFSQKLPKKPILGAKTEKRGVSAAPQLAAPIHLSYILFSTAKEQRMNEQMTQTSKQIQRNIELRKKEVLWGTEDRSERLNLRLEPTLLTMLRHTAVEQQRSLNSIIRDSVINTIKSHNAQPPPLPGTSAQEARNQTPSPKAPKGGS
jgi:predicted HicB family RNase H-like nuclease